MNISVTATMERKIYITLLMSIMISFSCAGQPSIRLQAGISYIEHFSAGITFTFSEKHDLSVLYGSDFFINNKDFLNILLQYNYNFTRLKFAGIIPAAGIKGGYSVYSNKYYRWALSEIIPFARLNYELNNKIDLFLDTGVTISMEHSVERLSYGEIGMYRKYLPEFKAGISFRL